MKIETPFELSRRLVSVFSMVVGPRGRAPCNLVVDTAAVYMTLGSHLAEAIGFTRAHGLRATVIRSAVGEERGYLVNLEQLCEELEDPVPRDGTIVLEIEDRLE